MNFVFCEWRILPWRNEIASAFWILLSLNVISFVFALIVFQLRNIIWLLESWRRIKIWNWRFLSPLNIVFRSSTMEKICSEKVASEEFRLTSEDLIRNISCQKFLKMTTGVEDLFVVTWILSSLVINLQGFFETWVYLVSSKSNDNVSFISSE